MVHEKRIKVGTRLRFTKTLGMEPDPGGCGKRDSMNRFAGMVVTVAKVGVTSASNVRHFMIEEDRGEWWYSSAWFYEAGNTFFGEELFEL